ncbi:hypothetical protein [Streptomyces cucumeris]|uniref:hypothetical protein n=1 Tax=Streptomyces cucumeris TaxID=2962890 RepID=UPI0020C84791|nr:hypothetical protein [Streptomyces sp. NEAU-Y11]MCP9212015.1 hypothetical protein [Streptomyces sp. NEAU-Y11]
MIAVLVPVMLLLTMFALDAFEDFLFPAPPAPPPDPPDIPLEHVDSNADNGQ